MVIGQIVYFFNRFLYIYYLIMIKSKKECLTRNLVIYELYFTS
jgi:hypothetical protein